MQPAPARTVEPKPRAALCLCVLASGSSGNCSALVVDIGPDRHLWLIDAGLSMKRTRTLLREVGLDDLSPRGLILTHLDDDHANLSAINALGDATPVFLHKRHLSRAEREGRLFRRTELLVSGMPLAPGCTIDVRLAHHDIDGSAALRFTLECDQGASEIGFATDVGRPTAELIDHLSGVDVLAIESNYCPRMQEAADRPQIVKSRVVGGSGHLSNQQCRRMVKAIAPKSHVVLLHLSRQCNTPELAAMEHLGADYQLSVSAHDRPTGWLEAPAAPRNRPRIRQESLFEIGS